MMEIKKILAPVDFSDNSPQIIDAAVYFAEKLKAKLSVIFVVQTFEDYSGILVPHMPVAEFEDEMVKGAEKKMETFLEENISRDISYEGKVLIGDVAEEITGFAEQGECDLIIMGTHGYKGLERILFGSVAAKVVKTASCPVMTINPYK